MEQITKAEAHKKIQLALLVLKEHVQFLEYQDYDRLRSILNAKRKRDKNGAQSK